MFDTLKFKLSLGICGGLIPGFPVDTKSTDAQVPYMKKQRQYIQSAPTSVDSQPQMEDSPGIY